MHEICFLIIPSPVPGHMLDSGNLLDECLQEVVFNAVWTPPYGQEPPPGDYSYLGSAWDTFKAYGAGNVIAVEILLESDNPADFEEPAFILVEQMLLTLSGDCVSRYVLHDSESRYREDLRADKIPAAEWPKEIQRVLRANPYSTIIAFDMHT